MNVENISLNKIRLGKNSRMALTEEDLSGLMESIKNEGLLEPIGVVKSGKGFHQIAYGNRRFMAYSKLGKKTIPSVVITNKKQADIDLMNLAENIQRSNISVVEVGRYIDHLMKKEGLAQREIKVRLGISQAYIAASLSAFRTVPKEFQGKIAVAKGRGTNKKRPGTITMSDVPAITATIKSLRLNKVEANKLYKTATHDKFNRTKINDYAKAIKAKKDPIKSVGTVRSISMCLLLSEREYNRIFTKRITDGPFKNMTQVIDAILSGKIHERVKLAKR